jgi:RNAse (barnase) inhibitor barstar
MEQYHLPSAKLLKSLNSNASLVDGKKIHSKDLLLDTLAEVVDFPDYFGKNWDALLDCLRDLSWRSSKGYVLLFDQADAFLNCCRTDFNSFVEIAAQAARDWRADNIPFHVFFIGSSAIAESISNDILSEVCDYHIDR